LASAHAFGRASPDEPRAGEGDADRLGRERILGFELAVEAAVGQAGPLADRVDAGGADAVLPEQPCGRGEDLRPVLRRSCLRDPRRWLLARAAIPLDLAEDGAHDP